MLAALRVAHERGVLHRDVKPGNVLIGNDGRIVLTDFGIAAIEGTSAITRTGEVVGSPEYLSPERALGRAAGPESDLWSLGVLLYTAVEGGSPFRRTTALSTLRAVVDEPLPAPQRAGPLAPVIEGLLRKEPAERLDGADAQRMLDAVAAGRTPYTPTIAGPPSPSLSPSPPATAPYAAPTAPTPFPSTVTDRVPHPRRAAVAIAAGALALALAAGGVAWALLDDGGGGSTDNGNSATSSGGGVTSSGSSGASEGSTAGSSTTAGTAGSSSAGTTAGSSSAGTTGSASSPAALTVTVEVSAVRNAYTGTCPPPEANAPSFSAVITVSRTPATVTYHWRTANGGSSDPEWKTVGFPHGGARSRTVTHTELSYPADYGTAADWIAVDVKEPASLQSNRVPFTVTCESPSPSDGGTTGGTTGSPTA